ncbi:MAG: hypothetical protein MJ223_01150 [Mycoplasmoidaceae bacterium]|nr:hypothetical protein [Mycoplasmoidaceae bacterium]
MENKYIKANYNFVKMLTAAELVKLSKTYKDNLEEIVVLMERKKKTPQQPPQ